MPLKPENELERSTQVILIRHGQSIYNAEGKCQGCSDESDLTEKGRNDMRQTGVVLKGLNLVRFTPVPSGEPRTRQGKF